ncbi:helicase-associated domain-containing protein [uncultured Jatrophihabitans sp.]|uniref:helicase-associated domain-containing protein n=1 Tax=uncultured Jatrophihabitans sp. TaxID=1610747 RepID=UPI0035CB3BB2
MCTPARRTVRASPTGAESLTESPSEQPSARAGSLAQWLRQRTDQQLTRLLQRRPDLALPTAPDLGALAARLGVRTSTQRAVDSLDAPALHALETLVLAAGPDDAVDDPQPDGLDALLDVALVWGDADLVHLTPSVRDAVGPYPDGLGRPADVLFARQPAAERPPLTDADALDRLLAQCSDAERDVLERLAVGPPVGSVRPTAGPSPVAGLVARGLLAQLDAQRVELPREVASALRARHGGERVRPPELVRRAPYELDQLATTAVRETLRLLDTLAELWSATPPAVLRSGGLGVRELRRTARELDVPESHAALLAEVAFAAALVNSTNSVEPVFLPSEEYDVWRERDDAGRWIAVATAWLAMTRQPSLVNERGERDRVITALGPDVERGTIPTLRRHVLGLLAELPPGAAPAGRADVQALLAWQQPRRAAAQRSVTDAVLDEADLLGVTVAGGLTGYTRTLLDGSTAAAEHALARALPEPVDHFLLQPDLTVVVPGPPGRGLGEQLARLADLESSGGASVYRITERSVRRALDTGRTGEQLTAFVEDHSRTPVPQALRYLIDDAARRHGVLRAGAASTYLRCDDENLLARVLADRDARALQLHLIAPTVLISEEPVNRVLDVLREAGFAPAAESPGGIVLTLDRESPRAPTRLPARAVRSTNTSDTAGALAEVVRRMRAGDAVRERSRQVHAAVAEVPGVTSAATMELLRTAVREERLVWLGVAQADGPATAHELHPISLAAGYVRGYERGRPGLASFPVHRITSVDFADEQREDT